MTINMSKELLSPLIQQAMQFAAIKHNGQKRKHANKKIPFIVHPACVGVALARAGYRDEVIAAGILHDVVEDCGVTVEELAKMFTPRVARLVGWVSEMRKDIPWEERKRAYRDKLNSAPVEALAIAAADHIHNLESLVVAYNDNPSVLKMFKSGMDLRIEHEKACEKIFVKRLKSPLCKEFSVTLKKTAKLLAGK
jgi:(p)ppGpp synthase/HD superfamily hydrolase